MPIKLDKDNILFRSIILSDGKSKNFTDLELAEQLGIERSLLLEYIKDHCIPELRQTKKTEFKCPSCNADVEIYIGMEIAYCSKCDCKSENIPYWNFGLNSDLLEGYLKKKILAIYSGSKLISADKNKLLLSHDNRKIAFLYTANDVGLDDLYLLKGWSNDFNPDFLVLVGITPSFTLSTQYSKGLVGLLTIDKLPRSFSLIC